MDREKKIEEEDNIILQSYKIFLESGQKTFNVATCKSIPTMARNINLTSGYIYASIFILSFWLSNY